MQIRLEEFPPWLDWKFDTVFFGGGTPSRMNLVLLENWIRELRNTLQITPDAEWSLEANPEDVSPENLLAWYELGFRRINMGYQTTHAHHLAGVGRYYDSLAYKNAPRILRESPFPSRGMDLMYGFPGQTWEEFREDLDFVLSSEPTHLSLYSLTVEKSTAYSRGIRAGEMRMPNEDLQIRVLEELPGLLEKSGWIWYEVSNFAKPGFLSRHNLKYWTLEPYLGIGPGAHGFSGISRYGNPRSIPTYQKNPGRCQSDSVDLPLEFAIGILRLFVPIDWDGFLARYPILDTEGVRHTLAHWVDRGFARYEPKTGFFQWNPSVVLDLDERIWEFSENFPHA